MTAENENAVAPNAHRFLWLGFMAIVASGVGFSIRGGILGDWGHEFGFTQTELGQITGGGLLGFGVIVLLGAVLAEAAGYGKLMAVAFMSHVVSAILTLAATPVYHAAGKEATYWCLYVGMFLFAIGNGILTVEDEEQARVRADSRLGDKGGHAARAALALYELREQFAP